MPVKPLATARVVVVLRDRPRVFKFLLDFVLFNVRTGRVFQFSRFGPAIPAFHVILDHANDRLGRKRLGPRFVLAGDGASLFEDSIEFQVL
jgi:hypothetical protein